MTNSNPLRMASPEEIAQVFKKAKHLRLPPAIVEEDSDAHSALETNKNNESKKTVDNKRSSSNNDSKNTPTFEKKLEHKQPKLIVKFTDGMPTLDVQEIIDNTKSQKANPQPGKAVSKKDKSNSPIMNLLP